MVTRRRKRAVQAPAVRTGNADVDRAMDALRDEVNRGLERPISKAAIRVELEWGLNKLDHALGETPYSWHATADATGAVITDAQDENPFPDRQLWVRLDGVAGCGATVWLY